MHTFSFLPPPRPFFFTRTGHHKFHPPLTKLLSFFFLPFSRFLFFFSLSFSLLFSVPPGRQQLWLDCIRAQTMRCTRMDRFFSSFFIPFLVLSSFPVLVFFFSLFFSCKCSAQGWWRRDAGGRAGGKDGEGGEGG